MSDYRQAPLVGRVVQEAAPLVGGLAAVKSAVEKFHLHGSTQHPGLLVREKYPQAAYHSSHRWLIEIRDET